ncbi:MAG: hypothetical protein R3B45_15345 [Bdellovibrionota bacterium]
MKHIGQKNQAFRWALIGSISLLIGCGSAKKDDSDDDDETSGMTQQQIAQAQKNKASEATQLNELNLSSSFNLALPSSLDSSGASQVALALQGDTTKKSMEACEVGRSVKEGIQSLESIGNMFCHLEVESDSIEFGKKYKISITGEEEEDIRIWIDDSEKASDKLVVNFCEGDQLSQVITITGVSDNGAKGAVKMHFKDDEQGGEFYRSSNFDVGYSETDRAFISASDLYEDSASNKFKRQLILDLVKDGTNKILVSNSGSMEGQTFSMAGAAKTDNEYGQVLFSSAGSHEGQTFEWTHRGHFNSEGYVVAADASTKLQDGGSLYVVDSDVPKYLPENFSIEGFGEGAWDCSADNDLVINMVGDRKDQHDACETDHNEDHIDCWSEEYQQSNEEHEIDEAQQKESSDIDELSEIDG